MKRIHSVTCAFALIASTTLNSLAQSPASDPWEGEASVRTAVRTWLPKLAATTLLNRVWFLPLESPDRERVGGSSPIRLDGVLPPDALKALRKNPPTAKYRAKITTFPPPAFQGGIKNELKEFEVHRFGRLLLAFPPGNTDAEPAMVGFDASGPDAAAIDDFYRRLSSVTGKEAIRQLSTELYDARGPRGEAKYWGDFDLQFRIAKLAGDSGDRETSEKHAKLAILAATVANQEMRTMLKESIQKSDQDEMTAIAWATVTSKFVLAEASKLLPSPPLAPDQSGRNAASSNTPRKGAKSTAAFARPAGWPTLASELNGKMEVRVKNPNDFKVRVGIRANKKGKDFLVGANDTQSVRLPNGRYDIFFQYSTDPEGLYQGDSFTLQGNGVEIQIVKVVNGNYGIRKVQ